MTNSLSLSLAEARKIALHAQRVLAPYKKGRALDATAQVIRDLGYIQIDTISVVERAHHHTLWLRNPRYRGDHLNKLMARGEVFEYWSHAAAYLPMEDFRHSLPYKQRVAAGDELWYRSDPKIRDTVYQRIREEGPLQSRDFENHGKTNLPMWEWKPEKLALEHLFMQGELMVARRDGFQKVYDLTERVLPENTDSSMPEPAEHARWLIRRYLEANGLGTAAQFAYLRKGLKSTVVDQLESLCKSGEILPVDIRGTPWYTTSGALDSLQRPLARSRLRILSPFDNLVIQRNRVNELFGFDYQIECYVTAAKRKFGYFCLPILWDAGFAGRMDCKADRSRRVLEIRALHLEDRVRRPQAFRVALVRSLMEYARFNGCECIDPLGVADGTYRSLLHIEDTYG